MHKTNTTLVLLAVVTIVACHTQAADRAVIEVRGKSESEVMWFRPDAVLFTDRGYRVAECPAGLAGSFFRLSRRGLVARWLSSHSNGARGPTARLDEPDLRALFGWASAV